MTYGNVWPTGASLPTYVAPPGPGHLVHHQRIGATLESSEYVLDAPAALTYAQTVLANNPSGYWKLNETSGTVAADSSATGNDGAYVGAAPSLNQPGYDAALGGAFLTAPPVNYVSIPHSVAQRAVTAITEEAWIYLVGAPADQSTILSKPGNHYFWINSARKLDGFDFTNGTNGTRSAVSTAAIPLATWTHVAAAVDSSGAGVWYINGVPSGTFSLHSTGTWQDVSSGATFLGCDDGSGDRPLVMRVQHAAVYPTKLSAAQILAHYQAA